MTRPSRLIAALLVVAAVLAFALVTRGRAAQPAQLSEARLPLVVQQGAPATATATSTTAATPTATIAAGTPTPTLPPADFVDCATVGDPARAPNYPIVIADIDKSSELVVLQNISNLPISLSGWRMCSVAGGQTHEISGVLLAGEVRSFFNVGGPIWNNSSSDPGALWNPSGQLVSYWPD